MKTLSEIQRAELIHAATIAGMHVRLAVAAIEDAVDHTGPVNGITARLGGIVQDLSPLAERCDQAAIEARPRPSVEITERRASDDQVDAIRQAKGAA